MSEQLGTKLVGSNTFKKLFRSVSGPTDIVPAVFPGGSAVTYAMGVALRNSATAGQKAKYTNAAAISDEAVGSGDGSTTTFDLDQSGVIASSFKAYVAGAQQNATISAGTGAGGVDQVVFAVAPVNAGAIKADYDYYGNAVGAAGACILMNDAATTVAGGNVTADACRDGSVDSAMVLDSAGAAVDSHFKAALPRVSFD